MTNGILLMASVVTGSVIAFGDGSIVGSYESRVDQDFFLCSL